MGAICPHLREAPMFGIKTNRLDITLIIGTNIHAIFVQFGHLAQVWWSRTTRRAAVRCRLVRQHLVVRCRRRLGRRLVRVIHLVVGLRRQRVVRRSRSRIRMVRLQISRCMRSGRSVLMRCRLMAMVLRVVRCRGLKRRRMV